MASIVNSFFVHNNSKTYKLIIWGVLCPNFMSCFLSSWCCTVYEIYILCAFPMSSYSLQNNLLRAFPVSSRFTMVYEYPTLCLYGVQPVYYSLWNKILYACAMFSQFTAVYEIKSFMSSLCPAGLLKPFLRLSQTQPKVGLECPKAVNTSKKIGLLFVSYGLLHSFCKPNNRLTTQSQLTTGKG